MKYWRGFLVAGIIGACTWGLTTFAKTHRTLVDMIFPYISRMITGGTAEWSSSVSFCVWQALLVFGILTVATLIGLAIILRWNFFRVSGWISAVVSLVVFFHVGIFGLNQYAGSLADDIYLKVTAYDILELEDAGEYYLEEAIKAYNKLPENNSHSFEELANKAGDGFKSLVYDKKLSVFAGSTLPVKQLGWADYYTDKGTTGVTILLTGESAVNPNMPRILLPYAMCHEMAHRMSIASDTDANFTAFLACVNNPDPYFVYSGYLNAYRYCLRALQSFTSDKAVSAVANLTARQNGRFSQDMNAIDAFYQKNESVVNTRENVQLLVSWYIQEIYLPQHIDDTDEPKFDPMDESQINLDGYVNKK